MQNLQKVYGTMNRFVYNIRNFQTDNKAVKGSVEIMQNLRILNESNDDSAGMLRNLLAFYGTIRGLVHDVLSRKTLYGTYKKFRPETAKLCEIC
jgi:hypothetical protein